MINSYKLYIQRQLIKHLTSVSREKFWSLWKMRIPHYSVTLCRISTICMAFYGIRYHCVLPTNCLLSKKIETERIHASWHIYWDVSHWKRETHSKWETNCACAIHALHPALHFMQCTWLTFGPPLIRIFPNSIKIHYSNISCNTKDPYVFWNYKKI